MHINAYENMSIDAFFVKMLLIQKISIHKYSIGISLMIFIYISVYILYLNVSESITLRKEPNK